MKKVRKSMIKKVAKIYAANLIKDALGTGSDSDLFNDGERDYLYRQLEAISKSISDTHAGTLDECISIAINHSNHKP